MLFLLPSAALGSPLSEALAASMADGTQLEDRADDRREALEQELAHGGSTHGLADRLVTEIIDNLAAIAPSSSPL